MSDYISFTGNPYRINDIRVGGFMDSCKRVREINGLSNSWGYEGTWTPTHRVPTIIYTGPYRPFDYGELETAQILSPEDVREALLEIYQNFDGFEKWCLENGGLKKRSFIDTRFWNRSAFTAGGWDSVVRTNSPAAMAGSCSIIEHVYTGGRYWVNGVCLTESYSTQNVWPGTIAICGYVCTQTLLFPEYTKKTDPAYLLAGHGTMQNGQIVDHTPGARKCWWEGDKLIQENMTHEEALWAVELAESTILDVTEDAPLPLRNTALRIVRDMKEHIRMKLV